MNSTSKKHFKAIYILGGHKLAYSYYEKIQLAKSQNLIDFAEIKIIDADMNCHARQFISDTTFVHKSNAEFLYDYLLDSTHYHPADIVVPDHTAKHVMLQAALHLIQKQFPKIKTNLSPLITNLQTPFLHKSENDAISAVSHATWVCPADCDEPEICPHTKSTRTWDLDRELPTAFSEESKTLFLQFPCSALVYEIAQIPMTTIITNFSRLAYEAQNHNLTAVVLATNSHCHGIIGKISIKS